MEGPWPQRILNFTKISRQHFRIAYNVKGRFTDVYIIDDKNKVAVFDDIYDGINDNNTSLMVAADHIKESPIIVNHSEHGRTGPIRGEPVDFKKLIETIKDKERKPPLTR